MKHLKWSALIALAVSFPTVMVPAHVIDIKYGDGSFQALSGLGYAVLQQHVPAAPDLSPVQATWALLGSTFTLAFLVVLLRLYKPVWWLLEAAAGSVFYFLAAPWVVSEGAAEGTSKTDENAKPEEKPKWLAFDVGGLLGVVGAIFMTVASIVYYAKAAGAALDLATTDGVPHWPFTVWTAFAALSITIGVLRGRALKRKRLAKETTKPPAVPPTDAELAALGLKKDEKPADPPERKPEPKVIFMDGVHEVQAEHVFGERSASQRLNSGEWSVITDLTTGGVTHSLLALQAMLADCRRNGWTTAEELVRQRLQDYV